MYIYLFWIYIKLKFIDLDRVNRLKLKILIYIRE